MSADPVPWKEPEILKEYWPTTQLFTALKQSARRYIRFKEESHYDVLTSWVMGTWLINKWRAFGPLYLLGDIGSGKTTVLEWLEEVCYRGIRGGSMSTSVMFHLSHVAVPTLLIDETQLYNKDEYAETQALINESYRKGGKVWRMTGEGRNMKPQFYNAYGARAFAASRPPWDALADRAILINMESTEEDIDRTLTQEFYDETKQLRDQLSGFADLATHTPSDSVSEFIGQIRNHRVQEIGEPLLIVAPQHLRDSILGFFKVLEKRHKTRKQTGALSDYVRALLEIEPERGKVSAKSVEAWFIEELGGKEKTPSRKTIMDCLDTLGFERTTMPGGTKGIVYDAGHLEEMRIRYCPTLKSTSSTSSTLLTKPVEEVDEVDVLVRCEYCDKPFSSHQEYEHHACPIGTGIVSSPSLPYSERIDNDEPP